MNWLPKLHKSFFTTTELSKLLTSCLIAIKTHVFRYFEKVYKRSGRNLFWSTKNSNELLNKLKSRGFRASNLSTYDCSMLYTTLSHDLIKEKQIYLLDNIFIRFGTKLYRQTIGIPIETNRAPVVADLFLFCYERDFMKSLSRENQADIVKAFNST